MTSDEPDNKRPTPQEQLRTLRFGERWVALSVAVVVVLAAAVAVLVVLFKDTKSPTPRPSHEVAEPWQD